MEHDTESVFKFIDSAEKSRKYAPNYASGIRTALRLFEKELNNEEKSSVDLFQQNIEQIYLQVVRKNQSTYSDASLDVYKKRVLKVLGDYGKYGKDPTKMINWNPVRHGIKKAKDKKVKITSEQKGNDMPEKFEANAMTKWELRVPSRPDVRAVIYTATDLSFDEIATIRSYINVVMPDQNKREA